MMFKALVLSLIISAAHAQCTFNFGSGRRLQSCSGNSETFEKILVKDSAVKLGEIPIGLEGLKISLTSASDVDIVLTSGDSKVIHWLGGVFQNAGQETKTFKSDSITYSGYEGSGGNGNEFIQFNNPTVNSYVMYAFGYAAGSASVSYTWTGKAGCVAGTPTPAPVAGGAQPTPAPVASGPTPSIGNPSGQGSCSISVNANEMKEITSLPPGVSDFYLRIDSSSDVDIELAEGGSDLVKRSGATISSKFARFDSQNVGVITNSDFCICFICRLQASSCESQGCSGLLQWPQG